MGSYSLEAKPARPELTVAGVGQLRDSSTARGLGNRRAMPSWLGSTDRTQIPRDKRTSRHMERPEPALSLPQTSALSPKSALTCGKFFLAPPLTPLPAAETGFPPELPVLGDN